MIAVENSVPDDATECLTAVDPRGDAVEAFVRLSGVLSTTGLDEALMVIARSVRTLVGVARCSIYMREPDGGVFRGRVIDGGGREMAGYIRRSLAGMPADGMTTELLETLRPVIVADAQNDQRMIRSNTRFWNIRSIMAVPMTNGDDVVGIIYLDDIDRPHRFRQVDAEQASAFARLVASAVVGAKGRAELAEKLEGAEARVRAFRQASAFDERLSELVLKGAELDPLVAAIAQMHGKPCAVYDAQARRLAAACPSGGDEGMLPTLLEEPHVGSAAVRAALAAVTDSRVFVVPPLPDAGISRRHLVAPIRLGDQLWGHLVMIEHRCRFSGTDMLTLRRAATQIAMHASAERQAVEADWNAGASLTAELLSTGSDPDTVARRAARLGVRLEDAHVVVVIAARDGRRKVDFRAVAAGFRDVAPGVDALATTLGESVAALVAVPAGMGIDEFLTDLKIHVDRICGLLGGELVAGISTPHSRPDRYPEAHMEAREIVDCLVRFGRPGGQRVFTAAELGLGRVFLAHADPEAITSFAEGAFGDLVRDEGKHDLLATLSCFFENMASVRRCALHLAVHENTIRYRLARIEELTGLAITHDPDAQLAARLSMLVLALTGALNPTDLQNLNQHEAAAGLKVVRTAY